MEENNFQNEYIRIADIIPNWDDIRIADIPELYDILLGILEVNRTWR